MPKLISVESHQEVTDSGFKLKWNLHCECPTRQLNCKIDFKAHCWSHFWLVSRDKSFESLILLFSIDFSHFLKDSYLEQLRLDLVKVTDALKLTFTVCSLVQENSPRRSRKKIWFCRHFSKIERYVTNKRALVFKLLSIVEKTFSFTTCSHSAEH